MRKYISLLILFAILISLVSCAQVKLDEENTSSGITDIGESESKEEKITEKNGETDEKAIESDTREIETVEVVGVNGYISDLPYVDFFRVDYVGDYRELFAIVADNDPDLSKYESPVMVADSKDRFDSLTEFFADKGFGHVNDYFDKQGIFDGAFFSENSLLIAYIVEGSGSITHYLYSCDAIGEEFVLSVVKNTPHCCTADMAGWFAIVGVPKAAINDCNDYSVKFVRPTFADVQADFAVELFKAVNAAGEGDNVFISPLSVTVALAMAANGATEFSETSYELYELLSEGMSRESFNAALASYLLSLPSKDGQKLTVSNSIWYRDTERMTIKDQFLQTNKTYYGAQSYKEPFNDATVDKVNEWIRNATDGMIDKVLQAPIDPEIMLYIINAICFDAKWAEQYTEYQVRDGKFTSQSGEVRDVEMMSSGEHLYIEDDYATGFVKKYEGSRYAFAALLPNENISIDEYIASLDGRALAYTVSNAQRATVEAKMPKFKAEYEIEMSPILKAMGLDCVFEGEYTDFGETAEMHDGTRLAISKVLHKTYIEVGEAGTRAAAVTVIVDAAGAVPPDDIKTVILDRPFVYAIVDTETGLPIFIGALRDITE